MRPGNFKPLPLGPSFWSLFSLAWKLLFNQEWLEGFKMRLASI
ncbi:hypothetical protein Daqu01_03364 [Deinococcus aquaticus]